jgi:Na+/melibiose symporter-like transporter
MTESKAAAAGLPLWRVIAFSLPNATVAALALTISVYLPRFFAAHIGIGLVAVGAAFGLVRMIDIAFDPLAGLVMDRTRTPIGRFRAWMLAGAPIVAIACAMLFMAPKGADSSYLVTWLLTLYIGYSLMTLSHISWGGAIAHDYHERSRVFGVSGAVGVVGASAVLALPILLPMILGKGVLADGGVAAMGWFLIVLAPLGAALAALCTPERIVRNTTERPRLRDYVETLARPEMLRIIIADFSLAMGPGWMAAMYLFFFHDSRGFSTAASNIQLFIYIAAGLVGAPALTFLARRIGKHRALLISAAAYSLMLIVIWSLPRGDFLSIGFTMFLLGACAVGFSMLIRSMVADVADVVRLEQGKHRLGLMYAMVTSTQKIATALSVFVSFTALAAMGYNPAEGAVNTPAAIRGLEIVYLIGPIFFVMLGAACFIGYRLDAKRHAEIRAQLDARDALTPETQTVTVTTVAVGQPAAVGR